MAYTTLDRLCAIFLYNNEYVQGGYPDPIHAPLQCCAAFSISAFSTREFFDRLVFSVTHATFGHTFRKATENAGVENARADRLQG